MPETCEIGQRSAVNRKRSITKNRWHDPTGGGSPTDHQVEVATKGIMAGGRDRRTGGGVANVVQKTINCTGEWAPATTWC